MARHSRPQAAYPGEWAFILAAKLVTAAPAHERQESKREAEAVAEAAAAAQNHDAIHELLEKVNEGEITGTHHLHVSATLGLLATNSTRLPVITPEPTGDEDDSDDDENSPDRDDNYPQHGDHPTHTGDAALESPTALPELDDGTVVAERDEPNKGAIAGGVIGALLFLSLLLGLFLFRRRIRQRIVSRKYNRMGHTPDPMVITRCVEPKLDMSERRGPLRTLFGSKTIISGGRGGEDMGLPPPAMIRYSTTTSRRESRNARYFRNSLLRGCGDAPGSPPGPRGTFYNPRSSSPSSDRDHSPPQFHLLSRANSDRFPIAIPTTSAPSSTSTSPTLADGFFHALSQPKAPLQAPQPVAVIPAFLIPETPVEPKDSHFSWSTTKTPQVPPTPGNQIRSARVSIADSEPKFRGVNSWVSNQRGRLERQGGMARQSQNSLPPQTPKEFRVHPGRQVSYGTGGERILSEDLDRVINGDRQSKGSRRFS